MANKKKSHFPNRKSMARFESEAQQKRRLTISFSIIGVLVIALAVFGVVKESVLDPKKTLITINEREYSVDEYQTWGRFKRYQLVNQYGNYLNLMQSFSDPETQSYFQSSLEQIQYQLEPTFLGAEMLAELTEDALIRQEAERLDISVSQEEIESYIAEAYFSYYPEGAATLEPTQEAIPTSTLSSIQMTLVPATATPEAVIEEVEPTPTEVVEIEPTAELPTATPYTEDAYQTQLNEFLEIMDSFAGVSHEELLWLIESDLYRDRVVKAVTADIESTEDQVWARHILVDDESTANEVLTRLEEGEDFAALAQELSTDTGSGANGGDLGWFSPGQMILPFEEAAFTLEIGGISEAIETQFGWHIIQVLGHESRPINDSRRSSLQAEVFQAWLEAQRAEATIDIEPNWMEFVPTDPAIPAQYLQQGLQTP
jgi:parvulin-like peptidyl-prolyl isomerase